MAIVINPTTGEDVRDEYFNPFVDKVVQFLYDHHNADFCKLIQLTNTNLEIDYGTARIKSVFYNTPNRAWPRCYPFTMGNFYLCKDWQVNPRANNADLDHLKEMIDLKFPMYKINIVSGEFQLEDAATSTLPMTSVTPPVFAPSHRTIMDVPTSADNLIRADYSYLRSLNPHSGAMPASHFNLTSNILASTGNVSFLALMDRIPVYIVDSRFMQEYFEKEDKHWEILRILTKLLYLLKEILDILQENEDAPNLQKNLKDIRNLINRLKKIQVYSELILKIEVFLNSIENWIEEHGITATIRNKYFERWLERIIHDFPKLEISTESLGVYCSDWERNGYHEKAIFICWERILEHADRGHAIDLLTKVTIHEFCHAYMDVIAGSGRASKDIYHWMEESMANVLTLKVIENHTTKHPSAVQLLKYAEEFMYKQPDAYASAVRLWRNGICDYDLWAWNKDKCVAAISINNWYKEMTASWETIANDRMRELWNEVRQEILGIS